MANPTWLRSIYHIIRSYTKGVSSRKDYLGYDD